jgi:hypothetical protein
MQHVWRGGGGPVAAIFILIPVAYIFLMLRRIFGEKSWLIVAGVTWATGHWS